jgi:signal transduction histidine kinase/ActR/RegA family two-component response regulator
MIGHAAATGETQVSGDVSQDTRYVHLGKEKTRSELAVAIKSGQTVIGVLDLQSDRLDAFDETDVLVMETLADQVAIAIRNARLYEAVQQELVERGRAEQQVRRLLEQQITVNRLAVALGESVDLDSIYRIIHDHVKGLMDVSAFIVSSYDSEPQLIRAEFAVTAETVRNVTDFPAIPLEKEGHGTQSQVIRTGQPLHVADWRRAMEKTATEYTVSDNGTVSAGAPPPQDQEDSTNSALLVPMKVAGETIGVMQVQSIRKNAYNQEDIVLLSALANVAAVAIQTGRLLEKTREQAQQVQRIIDTVPDGVLLLDTEARILLSNPAGQSYLNQLTDARVGDVLTHLGPSPLQDLLASPSGALWPEVSTETPPHRTFETVAQRMKAESQAGGWVLILRDVTEEREAQARIEQQERLAAMGQLAAGVAHDFNNVLQGIMSFSELLKRRSDMPETAKEHLSLILQLGERAARINRQILDFTRQSTAKKQPLDMAVFAQEVIDLLRRTIPEKIEFVLEAPAGGFYVHADTAQLQQVLVNLAINARDAMPGGGTLTLRLSRLTLTDTERPPHPDVTPGPWVCLEVSDTGGGIEAQILPRIFEPFFTTKEQTGGTGLGLAQVYGIVQQHDGHIGVESQIGEGTTFTLFLPAMLDTEAAVGEVPALSGAGQGQTILLVEDEPTVLQGTRAVLERLGYEVLAATNGREALDTYNQHRHNIALVLADMVMPKMDGVELFRALQGQHPDVKFVVMTGYPLREKGRELLTQGIVAWVQKPVTIAGLAAALEQALGQA